MHEYQDADRHITSSGSAVRTGDGRAGAAVEVCDGQGDRVVAQAIAQIKNRVAIARMK